MSNPVSDGERVKQLIYDWLNKNCAVGPKWELLSPLPLEIKMLPAFSDIEYNLGNGTWTQFLWNCFDDWRRIIDVAKEGYFLIGATEQSAALDTLRALCERDERECKRMQKLSEKDFERYFGEFISRSDDVPFDREALFYHDSGVDEKRVAWLKANAARIRKVLRQLQPLKKQAARKKRKVPKKRAVKKPMARKKR